MALVPSLPHVGRGAPAREAAVDLQGAGERPIRHRHRGSPAFLGALPGRLGDAPAKLGQERQELGLLVDLRRVVRGPDLLVRRARRHHRLAEGQRPGAIRRPGRGHGLGAPRVGPLFDQEPDGVDVLTVPLPLGEILASARRRAVVHPDPIGTAAGLCRHDPQARLALLDAARGRDGTAPPAAGLIGIGELEDDGRRRGGRREGDDRGHDGTPPGLGRVR